MGWFVITVVIPLIAPIVTLVLFAVFPLPAEQKEKLKLLTPIKDGQLCWGAIGFCVSALYEIGNLEPLGRRIDPESIGWANGFFTLLLVLSAALAGGGSVFTTAPTAPNGVHWARHYTVLVASLATTVVAAVGFTVVHFIVSIP